MSAATPVIVPLLNPNETEARLVALHKKDGQKVKTGDLIATLETTKSTFELTAEKKGYLRGLHSKPGEMLKAGETLCYLAASKDWKPPKTKAVKSLGGVVPDGLRITQPALLLAQKEGLDLNELSVGPIITEAQIRKALSKGKRVSSVIPAEANQPNAIIVYGGGGHGKAVLDLLRASGGYVVIGVVDDSREPGEFVLDAKVIGGEDSLQAIRGAGCKLAMNAVGGIGAMISRIHVGEKLLQAGFEFPVLVHPSAVVEPSGKMGSGTQVFPHAYVGSDVVVGNSCIVNTGAIVSHDCVLGDYANLAPGAILAGGVQVGTGTLIGMGVTINLNVRVGANARIGNGATVKMDVPDGGIVRAGVVWPN
ncbi:MAG: NeuD/PglB/VioB family sugar acetyltransferase [Anaerolineales bacterium]